MKGRPTELVLASTDVIHSLYLPDFRLKQDAVPGRFTRMAFTPTLPGSFPIVCAEFCGTDHSRMGAVAVVHPDQASFDAWSREGNEAVASLAEAGQRVATAKGCLACHSLDGSRRVGRAPGAVGTRGGARRRDAGPGGRGLRARVAPAARGQDRGGVRR